MRDQHQCQLSGVKEPLSARWKLSVKIFLKPATSGKCLFPPLLGVHWFPWVGGSFQWVHTAQGKELKEENASALEPLFKVSPFDP